MKNTFLFGITATTILCLALPTLAQQQSDHKSGMAAQMPDHCLMMMQMQQKIMSTTKAQDSKIKTLMMTMDKATGDRKVQAMAAVINELVTQRASRQEMNAKMQPQMMGHMMEHMQSGDKTAMMQCPMMGSMGMGHDMTKMKMKTK